MYQLKGNMHIKDLKVTCTILVGVVDSFYFTKEQEDELLNGVRIILSDSYDDFDWIEFDECYAREKRDLEFQRKDLLDDKLREDHRLDILTKKSTEELLPEAESA